MQGGVLCAYERGDVCFLGLARRWWCFRESSLLLVLLPIYDTTLDLLEDPCRAVMGSPS